MPHKKIATNTLFQILTRITTSFSSFILTVLIARNFGINGYGDYTKVTTFVGLFYILVDFGFNAVYLQKNEDDYKDSFSQLLLLRMFFGVLVLVLINLIAVVLPFQVQLGLGYSPLVKEGIALYSLTLIAQAVLYSSTAIFQKKLRYDKLFLASLCGSVTTIIFYVILLVNSSYFFTPLIALLIGSFTTAFVALFITKESILPRVKEIHFHKVLLLESFPLGLMLFFNLIYFRIDVLVLSLFQNTSAVGAYGLSYRFFDFLIALPLFLSNALYPTLLASQKNISIFFKVLHKYVAISLGLSIIIIIPLWLLAPYFSLIREDFTQSIVPFRLLLLSLPFFFLTNILQWGLIARKEQKYLAFVYLIVAVINIVLNAIFVPRASYIASAVITGVSEAIVFVFLYVKLKNLQKNIQSGKPI